METVIAMSDNENKAIRPDFVLKQIENEISAGFAFVAAARKAYKLSNTTEAESSLRKAAEKHEELLNEVYDTPEAQVRTITLQLSELRGAIEGLRANNSKAASQE